MSYVTTHLTTLGHLQMLAQKAESTYAKQSDFDELKETIDGIVSTGGEANVIDSISVNGTEQEVTDKNVDITVPTKTSDLENDSGYQTGDEVDTAVAEAVAGAGHASFEVAESVPDAESAESNVLYLVYNSDTGYYDIYALVGESVVRLDDTTVDLTDYVTSDSLTGTLESYVTSTALTGALADYILSSEIASDDEVTEMLTEIYGE